MALVRQRFLIMLSPYLVVDALPECDTDSSEDTPQAEPTACLCARTHVSHIPMDKLTLQEYQIFNAIKDTPSRDLSRSSRDAGGCVRHQGCKCGPCGRRLLAAERR